MAEDGVIDRLSRVETLQARGQAETERRLGNLETDMRELRTHIDGKIAEVLRKLDKNEVDQIALSGRIGPMLWVSAIIATAVVITIANRILAVSFPVAP